LQNHPQFSHFLRRSFITLNKSAVHSSAIRIGQRPETKTEGAHPSDLPRIFDRFYRGDASRGQQAGESGLGLAIAKSIVELHGGKIIAESELGAGTTFTIALPTALYTAARE